MTSKCVKLRHYRKSMSRVMEMALQRQVAKVTEARDPVT